MSQSDSASECGSDCDSEYSVDLESLYDDFAQCVRCNKIKAVNKYLENEDLGSAVDAYDERYPVMLIVASRGYLEIAQLLIDNCFGVDTTTTEAETPLKEAAEAGHYDMCVLLLDNGAKVDGDGYGSSPIYHAACNGHQSIVKLLVERGSKRIQEACYEAITSGHLDIVQYLCSHEKFVMFKNAINGAAQYGHINVLSYILECNGVDVNYRNKNGYTPLELASSNGHLEAVRMLVNKNAIVNVSVFTRVLKKNKKKELEEVLNVLVQNATEDVIKDLKTESGDTLLHLVFHQECFKKLLDVCDIDVVNAKGQTPLMMACKKGNEIMIKMLVSKKANIRARDNRNYPVIMYALRYGRVAFVETLLKKKVACKSIQTTTGKTMLHKAVKSGSIQLVKLLFERELVTEDVVNCKDNKGNTAIMMSRNLNITEFLIAKVKNINETNAVGDTALHILCNHAIRTESCLDIIKLLVDNHANKTLTNNDGESPMSICKEGRSEFPELYKLMKKM
jgi:ankyrin repeat protein